MRPEEQAIRVRIKTFPYFLRCVCNHTQSDANENKQSALAQKFDQILHSNNIESLQLVAGIGRSSILVWLLPKDVIGKFLLILSSL